MAFSERVLARKKPQLRMSFSTTAVGAGAIARASGKRANKPGVTKLTRLSVHWAASITATSNSKGVW